MIGLGGTTEMAASNVASRQLVYLTGFGPFPNVPANASALLVPRLAAQAEAELPGISVHWQILPTEWDAAPRVLCFELAQRQPTVILHFGVSSQAQGFVIESRGRNSVEQIKDAAGLMPVGGALHPAGPDFLPATVQPSLLAARLRRRGIPAVVSRDAGAYLCNAVLYSSLALVRRHGRAVRTGFVHLPATLAHGAYPTRGRQSGCPLDWHDVIDGGVELIAAALGRPPRPLARRWRMRLS